MKRAILVILIVLTGQTAAAQVTLSGGIQVSAGVLAIQLPQCISAFRQGLASSCTLQAVGGSGLFTWAKVSGSFPTGVADVTSAGVVAGTPVNTSTGTETVKVTDNVSGLSVTMAVPITPLSLSSIAVTPTGQSIQTSQTLQMTATCTWSSGPTTNCTLNVNWSCTTGAGCGSVNSSGLFTASASAGSATIQASLNSTNGTTTVTVSSTNPTIQTNATLCNGQVNQPYPDTIVSGCVAGGGQQLAASGGTPPYTWSLTSGSLQNLSLSSSGLLSGTVTGSGGTTSPVIQVCDSLSNCVSKTFSLVGATLSTLALTPASPTLAVGAQLQFTATGTFSDSSTANVTSQVVGGGASLAFMNSAGLSDFSGTSHTTQTTGTFNLGAGNLLVVLCRQGNSAATCNAPTDTAGNTLLPVDSQHCLNNNTSCARLFYAANTTANTSDNVTCNMSSSAANTICIATQYSGVATSTPLDVHGVNDSGTNMTSTMTGASVTTTSATEVVIMGGWGQFHGKSFTAGTGYTIDGVDTGTYANSGLIERQFVTSTGTYQPTATVNATNETGGLTATFIAAAAGTGWSATDASGGPNVASCNSTGLCIAQNAGTSTIKAAIGAVSGTTVMTVTGPSGDTSLSVTSGSASVGSTVSFTATGVPSGQNDTSGSTWSSSNTTIFSFASSSTNTGTCNAAGSATVTATFQTSNGPISGSNTVTCNSVGTQSLLQGCTVSASNVVQGCTNSFPPSGWTQGVAQGFESGALGTGQQFDGTSICSGAPSSTCQAHTGTHALLNTIPANSGGNQSVGGDLGITSSAVGCCGSGGEFYASWWTYITPLGKSQTESVIAYWSQNGQTILMDTQNPCNTQNACTNLTTIGGVTYGLTTNPNLWLSPQSNVSPNDCANTANAKNCGKYGANWSLNLGTWMQNELWVHQNTCTSNVPNDDGFVRYYQNGKLVYQLNSSSTWDGPSGNGGNGNGCISMSAPFIRIGGFWTYFSANPNTFQIFSDDMILLHR